MDRTVVVDRGDDPDAQEHAAGHLAVGVRDEDPHVLVVTLTGDGLGHADLRGQPGGIAARPDQQLAPQRRQRGRISGRCVTHHHRLT